MKKTVNFANSHNLSIYGHFFNDILDKSKNAAERLRIMRLR